MKTGITGGIGSGKSYICELLQQRGIQVYDCDQAAKRIIRTSPEVRQQLHQLIGSLERADIARYLLESEQHAHQIDAIVHPAVFQDFIESGIQWMESAILFESGINSLVDRVIVVTAPEEVRIQRIQQRDGITRQEALQWMQRQWPQDELLRRADHVIVNDGQADLNEQLDQLLNFETSKSRNIEIRK